MNPNEQPPAPQPEQVPTQAPAPAPVQAENPGKGLGIASLVTSLVGLGLVGVILGIIGLVKSKKAGMGNGFALAGLIIGVINVIGVLIFSIVIGAGILEIAQQCLDSTTGTVVLDNGQVVNCEAS